jgi:leucyl aminopeptidase
MFTNNDALQDRVLKASKAEGERMWPLPMDDDYKEYLKSAFADLGNIGGRWCGAIAAAIFLKEFADETPWVHLDIAGTAWLDDAKRIWPKDRRAFRCGRWARQGRLAIGRRLTICPTKNRRSIRPPIFLGG